VVDVVLSYIISITFETKAITTTHTKESILWFLIYNILRLIFGSVSKVIGKGWWKLN